MGALRAAANRRRILAILALALGGALVLFFAGEPARERPRLPDDLSFQLIDGTRASLGSFRGRPLLVHFWATSCAVCVRKIPDLAGLQRALPQVPVIAVAMPYDRPDTVLALVRKQAIPYRVALDLDGSIVRAFGDVPGTPTTFLLNTSGRIDLRVVGPPDFAALERRLRELKDS